MSDKTEMAEQPSGPLMLVVDDDRSFCRLIKRVMERRGYRVKVAHTADHALWVAEEEIPALAVVDLNMPGPSGLELIPKLKALNDAMRIVVLTGYGSVATAVHAIKHGAVHYLAKPATPEEIVEAFDRDQGDPGVAVPEETPSLHRMEWEHIQRVLMEHKGDLNAAADALGIHRRTLQRKLAKGPGPERA